MSYLPPFGPVPRRKRTASSYISALDLVRASSRARASCSAHGARVLGSSSSNATASIVEDSESSGPEDFGAQVYVTVMACPRRPAALAIVTTLSIYFLLSPALSIQDQDSAWGGMWQVGHVADQHYGQALGGSALLHGVNQHAGYTVGGSKLGYGVHQLTESGEHGVDLQTPDDQLHTTSDSSSWGTPVAGWHQHDAASSFSDLQPDLARGLTGVQPNPDIETEVQPDLSRGLTGVQPNPDIETEVQPDLSRGLTGVQPNPDIETEVQPDTARGLTGVQPNPDIETEVQPDLSRGLTGVQPNPDIETEVQPDTARGLTGVQPNPDIETEVQPDLSRGLTGVQPNPDIETEVQPDTARGLTEVQPDPDIENTEFYKEQLRHPTRVSVVIMNWKRPQNVQKILSRYKDWDSIAEVIVWMCNPSTSFEYDHPKVRIINEPESNDVHGLSTRFKGCLLAKSPWVLIQDDDHQAKVVDLLAPAAAGIVAMLKPSGIAAMLKAKATFPNRLVGPFARDWPNPGEPSYKTTGKLPLSIGVPKVFMPQRKTGIHFGAGHGNYRDDFVKYAIKKLNLSYEKHKFGSKPNKMWKFEAS
eukprot:gene13280-19124_t